MTKEEKQLLLNDLCARLPYGIICKLSAKDADVSITEKLKLGGLEHFISGTMEIKPYLRPMSSMTEEENEELKYEIELELQALEGEDGHNTVSAAPAAFEIDFYNKHRIDYRGLIPKGLALEAPEGMYKTKIQ